MAELERLLVRIEADTAQLRRELRNAELGVDNAEKQIGRSLRNADRQFSAFSSSAINHLKSVAAFAAAGFSLRAIPGVVESTAQLGRLSEEAGLTAQKYQELSYAAAKLGVDHGVFENVMSRFATTMGEVRARSGGFYEFLQNHLPTLDAQLRATKGQAEAFEVLSTMVGRMKTAEDRAALTKAALGEAGQQMLRVMTAGKGALADAAKEAHNLGAILDSETIEAARRTDGEFKAVTQTLDAGFKSAVVGAVSALGPLTGALKTVKDAMADVGREGRIASATKGFFDGATQAELKEALSRVRAEVKGLSEEANKPASERSVLTRLLDLTSSENGTASRIVALTEAASKLIDQINRPTSDGWEFKIKFDEGAAKQNMLSLQQKLPPFTTEIKFEGADALRDLEAKLAEARGETLEAIRINFEKELEAFRRLQADKLIDEEEFQRARVQLNEIAGQKIIEADKKIKEEARKEFDQFGGIIENTLTRGFHDVVRNGKADFKELTADFAAEIATMAFKLWTLKPVMDAVFSLSQGFGGGGGSWLPTVSMFATGGQYAPGKPFIAGERGPELVVPDGGRGGRVYNASETRAMAGGGGNSVTYNIDARNADAGVEQRIMAAIMEMERRRPNPVSVMEQHRRRFPGR